MTNTTAPWTRETPTAIIVLADGTVIEGKGCGATGNAVAEICFNTAITGYQEILTDPSYAGQVVVMTCPQIDPRGLGRRRIEGIAGVDHGGEFARAMTSAGGGLCQQGE